MYLPISDEHLVIGLCSRLDLGVDLTIATTRIFASPLRDPVWAPLHLTVDWGWSRSTAPGDLPPSRIGYACHRYVDPLMATDFSWRGRIRQSRVEPVTRRGVRTPGLRRGGVGLASSRCPTTASAGSWPGTTSPGRLSQRPMGRPGPRLAPGRDGGGRRPRSRRRSCDGDAGQRSRRRAGCEWLHVDFDPGIWGRSTSLLAGSPQPAPG